MVAGISSRHSGAAASKLMPGCLQYIPAGNAGKEQTGTGRWESRLQPAWLGSRAGVIPGVGTRDNFFGEEGQFC